MGTGWYPRLDRAFFLQMDDSDIIFRGRDKRIVYAVLRSIAVPPQSQADTWSHQVRRHAVMGAEGMNGCQERHGARSLMARNFTERLGGDYDLEP